MKRSASVEGNEESGNAGEISLVEHRPDGN